LLAMVCVGNAFAADKGDNLITAKKVSKDPVDVSSADGFGKRGGADQ